MKITLWFSGPAGSGINTCWVMLWSILAKYGYFVYGDKEYSSLVKGGNNLFVLAISDTHHFVSSHIDHYLYFDAFAKEKNAPIYTFGTEYFIDKKICSLQNTYAIGVATKLLSLPKEDIETFFLEKIKDVLLKEKNKEALTLGWNSVEPLPNIQLSTHVGEERIWLYGNEVLAKGAITSGLDFYSAYPMTPATSIIDAITAEWSVEFFQWEDEIAVAMSMLGAKFAGKRAMCGTSGGWFALMSESLSFSNQAEIWGVYILSQRAGPSTGTPTFTGQWDLSYALNATFGDTFPIVVAPSSFENAYNLIGKALNWSDMYGYPVIVLVDKSFSESALSILKKDCIPEKINHGKRLKNPKEDFARYALTEDGISEYTIPGTPSGEFIATSYEHDIYGKETEDPKVREHMEEKRFKKLTTFKKNEFNEDFFGFDVTNPEATTFYITYGTNAYTIRGFLYEEGHDSGCSEGHACWHAPTAGLITITSLQPIDPRLKIFLEQRKNTLSKLIFVEQNYSGQLEALLTEKLDLHDMEWQSKLDRIRSYNLYPLFEENIWEHN